MDTPLQYTIINPSFEIVKYTKVFTLIVSFDSCSTVQSVSIQYETQMIQNIYLRFIYDMQ